MRRTFGSAALLALVTSLGLWYWAAGLPLFSESFTHLELASGFAGIWDSFDVSIIPLRPAQHAWFYVLHVCGDLDPGLARLPAYVLHLLSTLLLYTLVRQLGGSGGAALVAALAFLAFPSAKALIWVASIGWPGKTCATLAALCLFVAHRRAPGPWTGLGLVACTFLALCFHQSAFLLPAFFALLLWAERGGAITALPGASARLLRNPWTALCCVLVFVYVVYVVFLREARVHHMLLGALPANAVRAATSLLPEALRVPAVDGLRGLNGTLGYLLGAAIVAAVAGAWSWGFWRSRGIGRFVLAAIALELAVPVLTTGFAQRYAYPAAALACIGLAFLWDRLRGAGSVRWAAALAVLVVGLWSYDQLEDLREHGEAGGVQGQIVTQLLAVEQSHGVRQPLVLVGAPWFWGREQDLPLCNWGLGLALRHAGSAATWILVTPGSFYFTSDFQRLPDAELARLLAQHRGRAWRWDPGARRYREVSE